MKKISVSFALTLAAFAMGFQEGAKASEQELDDVVIIDEQVPDAEYQNPDFSI
jgi:hypothetical protein